MFPTVRMVKNVYMMIYLVCLLCIVNYCYGQVAFISFSNKLNYKLYLLLEKNKTRKQTHTLYRFSVLFERETRAMRTFNLPHGSLFLFSVISSIDRSVPKSAYHVSHVFITVSMCLESITCKHGYLCNIINSNDNTHISSPYVKKHVP